MKIANWIEKIALFSLSSFLTTFSLFTLLEFFPQLPHALNLDKIHYYSLKGRYASDPELIFRNQPGLSLKGYFTGDIQGLSSKMIPLPYITKFDSQGFQNTEKPSQTDIVVLGDSFMQFGLNKGDSFTDRLEKASGQTTANYGTEWYGPIQYLKVFEKYALTRSPKIALFCFFEGNDLRDTEQYLRWKKSGNYYHFNLTSKNFFQRYLIATKDTAIYFIKLFLKQWDPRKITLTLKDTTLETVFVYPLDGRSVDEILNSMEGKTIARVLQQFKKISTEHQITPFVLFIPSTAHIYTPYVTDGKIVPGQKSYDEQSQYENHVEDAIKKLSALANVGFLSLAPLFQNAAKEGQMLYYVSDTHWNEVGRQIAAAWVATKLNELKEPA